MKLILVIGMVLALGAKSCAKIKSPPLLNLTISRDPIALIVQEQEDLDALQLVRRQDIEQEGDEKQDQDFDRKVLETSERPTRALDKDGLKKEVEGKDDYLRRVATTIDYDARKVQEVTPKLNFLSFINWKPPLDCCPRSYKYGCRHSTMKMPCFASHYYYYYYINSKRYYRHEWCCPLWPYMTMARCLCDKCHIQASSCVLEGKCHRRYTPKSFIAVCYRLNSRPFLRFFSNYNVPSSCYCRTQNLVKSSQAAASLTALAKGPSLEDV